MAYSEAQFKVLVAEIGEYNKQQVNDFFAALKQAVQHVVGEADKASIPGIGRINCSVRESRMARNPRTGEAVKTKPKVGVRLSVSKSIKDSVPSIKKGRTLIEAREASKKKTARGKTKKTAAASNGRRSVGRPKGTTNKKTKTKTRAKNRF